MLTIAIDCDGVLRDFIGKLDSVYRRVYPDHWTKPVVQWDLHPSYELGRGIYEFAFQSKYAREIYEDAHPYPGARQFMEKLYKIPDVSVYICSHQTPRNEIFTCRWLRINNIPYHGLLFLEEKEKFQADIILDDKTDTLVKCSSTMKSICMDRPWNKAWSGDRIQQYDEFFIELNRLAFLKSLDGRNF